MRDLKPNGTVTINKGFLILFFRRKKGAKVPQSLFLSEWSLVRPTVVGTEGLPHDFL